MNSKARVSGAVFYLTERNTNPRIEPRWREVCGELAHCLFLLVLSAERGVRWKNNSRFVRYHIPRLRELGMDIERDAIGMAGVNVPKTYRMRSYVSLEFVDLIGLVFDPLIAPRDTNSIALD